MGKYFPLKVEPVERGLKDRVASPEMQNQLCSQISRTSRQMGMN